uniref:Uncharacterized protein n=1 Tax=Chromera velia CCMP2878 TaxID=1169474 RepID=A0A0G4HGB0_9ALVE|eukprot:Cvel_27330.t1-p1 / transcript=Cvel_27330.t1 / gene=Cvel_27330 / organism=Chromera_velia_CCMP2878 / gene_product=hypothetical protein / transcript_product=hypothetical protein / location=Cvel_scaffold3391:16493-17306(+) / protein_length=209 / sequence_SO=supercontig / SO=protein_coding / is_pseudo=false
MDDGSKKQLDPPPPLNTPLDAQAAKSLISETVKDIKGGIENLTQEFSKVFISKDDHQAEQKKTHNLIEKGKDNLHICEAKISEVQISLLEQWVDREKKLELRKKNSEKIVEEEVEKGTFPAIPAILEKWNILSFSIISRSNEGRRWTIGEIEFDQEHHRLFSHLYEACRAQMNVLDKRDPLPLFSLFWETTPKIRIHTEVAMLEIGFVC